MEPSIIIVSWNVKDLLRQCLVSLLKEGTGEIIVVDNASADGTVAMVQKEFPAVQLIANKENRGFAAACNEGAAVANGNVLLFLNPDCQVQRGTLQGVVQFFKEHNDAGVMGAKILNTNGTVQPSVRRFPGFWDQLLILWGIHKIVGASFSLRSNGAQAKACGYRYRFSSLNRYFVTDFDYRLEAQVDQVMGAFFAVPKYAFEKLGGFDERFFVWFEEVDFCKRVQQAGLKVYYSPHVSVVHHGGASFKQVNRFRRRLIWLQSLWRYFRKHGV